MYNRNLMIGIALLIVAVAIFGFRTASIVSIQGRDPIVREDNWNGIPIKITSAYIGSLTNTPLKTIEGELTGGEFCGSNDADLILVNSYNTGEYLTLSSSIGGSKRKCGENYIIAEIELPAGELKVNTDLSVSAGYKTDDDESHSKVIISSFMKEYYNSDIKACDTFRNECKNLPASKSDSLNIKLDEPTKIKVELYTSKSALGSANSNVALSFSPAVVEVSNDGVIIETTSSDDSNTASTSNQESTPKEDVSLFSKVESFFRGILIKIGSWFR
jgi:hypothetical protein